MLHMLIKSRWPDVPVSVPIFLMNSVSIGIAREKEQPTRDNAGGTSLFSSDVDPLLLRGRQDVDLVQGQQVFLWQAQFWSSLLQNFQSHENPDAGSRADQELQ